MASRRAQRPPRHTDDLACVSARELAPAPDPSRFVNPFNDRRILEYYRDVQAWHGYIRFLGLPHLREEPDVPIDSLYVPPELSAQAISPDQPATGQPRRTDALECIVEHPRLVVLGDPGSGKSSLVSWIAWNLSRGPSSPWTQALGPLLPLPLVVRDLRLTARTSFDDLLAEFLRQLVAEPLSGDAALIEAYLERGQCFLLLDGLDEVGSETTRRGLWRAVREGVARYPSCRWLLTSRQVGYDRVRFHQVDLDREPRDPEEELLEGPAPGGTPPTVRELPETWAEVRYVAPFQDRQIEAFAHNWYARTHEARPAAEAKALDLVSAVHANLSTERLARVPNLLTLMALIHRIQARLPHGRALLYDKIVEAYLESIDAYRGIQEVDYSLEEKKRWLAWVGFRMQRRRSEKDGTEGDAGGEPREILVDEDELLVWLEEAMARSPRLQDVAEPGHAARAFVHYIARRSGLLLPRGHGQYAFNHLSFQEFFAAVHLEARITSPRWSSRATTDVGEGPADLERYAGQDTWREPLVLLFGLFAGRPEWAEELAIVLFGEAFDRLAQDPETNLATRALLLAEVSTDPHSGLPGNLRELAWDVCWRWELRRQSSLAKLRFANEVPRIARTLAGADPSDQPGVWRSLQRIAAAEAAPRLSLAGSQSMRDLSPLARLEKLQWLVLSGTPVSDLSPLARLENLQGLNLSGTQVSDLSPLARLENLQVLYLSGTQVSDLSPLARLENLQWLNLSGTQVSDLSPLARLENLQILGAPTSDPAGSTAKTVGIG
jgi:internalin A